MAMLTAKSAIAKAKKDLSPMGLSEVMSIVTCFHGNGYRTFREFDTLIEN